MSAGWVKFENSTPDNMKVAAISDKAFRLFFNAICYSSRGRTSGKVPANIMPNLSPTASKKTIAELLEAGLVERLDERTYLVHDYLDYNPSREKIDEMRAQGRERVAAWRAERNGVTGADVTALQGEGCNAVTSSLLPRARSRDRSVKDVKDNHPNESKPGKSPPKRANQNELPASLPSEMHSTARDVLEMLEGVQDERGGLVPTLRGVGLAIDRFRERDHVAVARELQHWALAGNGQSREVRDWARTFATFLDKAPAGKPSSPGGGSRVESIEEHLRRRGVA